MLSKKSKYGIKALINLANAPEPYEPKPLRNIAEEENIPLKFLEAIMLSLKNQGLVASKKGKVGGYYLLKKPEDILMLDVYRILVGPVAMVPCVSLNYYEKCDDCHDENVCAVNRLMIELRDSALEILENKTLAELTY